MALHNPIVPRFNPFKPYYLVQGLEQSCLRIKRGGCGSGNLAYRSQPSWRGSAGEEERTMCHERTMWHEGTWLPLPLEPRQTAIHWHQSERSRPVWHLNLGNMAVLSQSGPLFFQHGSKFCLVEQRGGRKREGRGSRKMQIRKLTQGRLGLLHQRGPCPVRHQRGNARFNWCCMQVSLADPPGLDSLE